MMSVHAVVREELSQNPYLQFGHINGLFNLTQLARFLRPTLEVRARKELSESSIVMALSRILRESQPKGGSSLPTFQLENIQVASNLSIVTYSNTNERRREIAQFVRELQNKGRYVSFTHGLRQITLFLNKEEVPHARDQISGEPNQVHETVAVVGAMVDPETAMVPGFFTAIFQQLYLQNINILEIASTSVELLIYVDEDDLRLTFDTLYNNFVKRRSIE